MAESATQLTPDATLRAQVDVAPVAARSPWSLARRSLRQNYVALVFLGVFVLVVAGCALAPLYARYVAHTGPDANHIIEKVRVGNRLVNVTSPGGTYTVIEHGQPVTKIRPAGVPVGPLWWRAGGRFVLGADENGRDVAVRLLYGGITSLEIGIGSALICVVTATVLALLAGYHRGWLDWAITRLFDLIWAFPVILLAIALGTALAVNGFHHFGLNVSGGSRWIPTLVISYVLIPYVGRPVRAQILSLREREFVEAAVAQGAGGLRIMFRELLPNVASTVLVFFTLIIANNILLEAALSFLGAGVQPPNPSWGTLIAEGQDRIVTAPWLTLAPGIAIVLTVLSLNVFGDGLRDALDPRSQVRIRS